MKIAIIGAGWYGCHIASSLLQLKASVTIFEKNKDIFLEASSNNQYRLHQGLHYARSSKTRHQSRDGFFRFIERYPSFSKAVRENYYLIPKRYSLMDFDTYFAIMFSSGIDIEKVPLNSINHIDEGQFQGAVKTTERVLLNTKAKIFFNETLNSNIRFNQSISSYKTIDEKVVICGEEFDYLINATWGGGGHDSQGALFYEPTLLLYYSSSFDFPALTLVDGPLLSIYPTEENGLFTLSSVSHTPLGSYNTKNEAYKRLEAISELEIQDKRTIMEQEVKKYIPNFSNLFTYVGPQLSIKTKPIGLEDNRYSSIEKEGRIFIVNSGKVDNIFQASDFIIGQIYLNE